jgi:hypothetical protein
MMNESRDPGAQKWFNTDAGRTIIGASIVGANHPAGAVKRSDLHPHLHPHLLTELSGADHRVELGRAVDLLVQLCTDAWRCG